ncbi:MAG TPA: SUMF1/EgtB/PvdO family nonheme iron enzyme [Polyangiaceae bacterium]|nr:SUMF1/EgtB/PvdO family nonheme iron enzyme [Polyangiaceae bacterium]
MQLKRGIPATVTDVGTHPKGRSFFGVDDMSGNLSEWVADACHLFTSEPAIDLKGPSDSDGKCRIKRGAGWSAFNAGWARATMRFLFRWPLDRDYETGFRCAYDPR